MRVNDMITHATSLSPSPCEAGIREGDVLRERPLQPAGADDPGDEPAGREGQPEPLDGHARRRQRLLLQEQEPDQ